MPIGNTETDEKFAGEQGETPCLKLSPRAAEQVDVAALPKPLQAIEHYKNSIEKCVESHPQVDQHMVDNSIEFQDAVTAGMIVHPPCQIRGVHSSDTSERSSLSVVHDRYAPGELPIVESLDSHPDLFTIDTKWDLTIPEGVQVLVIEPSVHTEGIVETIPQVLEPEGDCDSSTNGAETVPLKAIVKITQTGRITKVNPVLQLVPIKAPSPSPSYRTVTSEEEDQITKNERKLVIYPEWYSEQRCQERHFNSPGSESE